MPRRVFLIVLGTLVCLVIGVAGMRLLMSTRQPPQRQVSEAPGKLVRVLTVAAHDIPLTVQGFGTVRARTEWSMIPEVSGPVVQLSPQMRAGLHVKQGELLVEIDARPYRLVVQRIQAQITQWRQEIAFLTQQRQNYEATLRIARRNLSIAEADLQRNQALVRKGTLSTRELDLRRQWRNEYANAVQASTNNLSLIAPQIGKAEAAIAVAQVQLAEAQLQVQKTRLLAPFDGQVVHTSLALREVIQAGREVARLYETAAVEIPIAIPLGDLRWLPTLSPDLFRHASAAPARSTASLPTATVRWGSGAVASTWQGQVVRWEAGLDAQTRTLTLVVEVREPWATFRPGQQPPLQPGMFCEVEILAMTVPDVVVLPRAALHDSQTVFLAHAGVLAKRSVQVFRLLRDQALITAGLQPGDKVIVSPLQAPMVGTKLRLLEVDPPLGSPSPATAGAATEAVIAQRPIGQPRGRQPMPSDSHSLPGP